MPSLSISLVIAVVVVAAICIWAIILFWIRRKTQDIAHAFKARSREMGETLIIDPQSCVYRGSDREYGNIKGNGVIALTNKRILFKKLIGQEIVIELSHISGTSIENTFKGETAFATGAQHLVVVTTDDNRIGFLVRNAEKWIERLNGG